MKLRLVLSVLVVAGLHAGCTSRTGTVPDASNGTDSGVVVDAYVAVDAPPDAFVPDAGNAGPVVFFELGAPIDSPTRFEDPGRTPIAPAIAYPADGVIVPPNLAGLEVHFAPEGHALFELTFSQGDAARMVIYDGCQVRGIGCALELSDAMWEVLATNRGRGAYTLVVRGIGAAGTSIGESTPIVIELADEPVTGGLYFWTTEPAAIHRYDFDRARRESEVFYDSSDAEGHCVGCHALSRDGRTIGIGYGTEGPIAMVDVASRTSARMIAGQMSAFSPDGLELVLGGIPAPDSTGPLRIARVDGTGTPIDLGMGAAPDWSPDGDSIVFTQPDGALRLLDLEAGTWTPRATTLTGGGASAYDDFPSFAPGSDWIAFSRIVPSSGPGGVEKHVWVARRDAAGVTMLARASRGTMDSMPRWNPSTFLHDGHQLFWLTFTSNMPYGVEGMDGRRRQIWMAAFDPTSTEADPSHPAFRLPSQPSTGSSFIPQWTTTIARQPCDDTSPCRAGEMCEDGVCIPEII